MIYHLFKKLELVIASMEFQKIMVQYGYSRICLGTETVSCRLLQRMATMKMDYSQTRSSVPPQEYINEFIIQKLNPLLVVDLFQIDLCILVCVMSREFTPEAVIKFLPALFS